MNPLKPSPTLIVKLGSIVVHSEELISPKGHEFDMSALEGLLGDPEITEWLAEMKKLALIPEKR